jgi:hypothetical protein
MIMGVMIVIIWIYSFPLLDKMLMIEKHYGQI